MALGGRRIATAACCAVWLGSIALACTTSDFTATPDAGTDGSAQAPDGGAGPDTGSGSDAPVADAPAGDALVPWCNGAGSHTFCDDFDYTGGFTKWDNPITSMGAIDRDLTRLPFAMRSAIAATAVGPVAKLTKPFAGATGRKRLFYEFDLNLEAYSQTDGGSADLLDAYVATITDNNNDHVSLRIVQSGGQITLALEEWGPATHTHAIPTFTLQQKQFVRCKIEISIDQDAGGTFLYFDAPPGTRWLPMGINVDNGWDWLDPFRIDLGLQSDRSNLKATAVYDNVTFDLQ